LEDARWSWYSYMHGVMNVVDMGKLMSVITPPQMSLQ